jgi:pimeloyl-ACP methyl ester carboxylesterase
MTVIAMDGRAMVQSQRGITVRTEAVGVSSVAAANVVVEVQGEGPPVLFLHGLGGSSNLFQPLLGALAGFRCLRPDLPGSARSPRPADPISLGLLLGAVREVMRARDAQPAHVVGHSLGSLIGLALATQAPAAVLSLTLFGPLHAPTDAARQRLAERARLARQEGMAAVADAVIAGALAAQTQRDHPLAAAFVRESHMRQDPEGFAQTCEAVAAAPAAELDRIAAPVMLVTGEDDAVTTPGMAWAIADRVRGARTKILAGCGHWTPVERPRECAAILAEFLRATSRR